MIYEFLKNVIKYKDYLGKDKDTLEDMRGKIDLFLLYNRITKAQYEEVVGLLPPITPVK